MSQRYQSCFTLDCYSLFAPQQKYIAQVLQEQGPEETGSGAEYGQGSSQDDELITPGSVVNEGDFQSGEDSLIDNEVHQ